MHGFVPTQMRRVPRTFGIRRTVGWTALRGARSSGGWSPDRTSWSVSQSLDRYFKEQGFCLDLTMFARSLWSNVWYTSVQKFGVSNKYNVLDYQISTYRIYHGFPQHIRNNKCFQHWLIIRNVSWAAYQNDFWRIMWLWRLEYWKCIFASQEGTNYILIYVTLDHKTSHEGPFFKIEINISSESWINKLSIDVWFVMIGQYLLIYNYLEIWILRVQKKSKYWENNL